MPIQLTHSSESDVQSTDVPFKPRDRQTGRRTVPATQVLHRQGAEHYDHLLWRLNLPREAAGDVGLALGIIGCGRQMGASTLAANLAIRAADHHLGPVLLVDANAHYPALHQLLSAARGTGLGDVLVDRADLEDCIQATPVAGLSFLPLGAAGQMRCGRIEQDRIDAVVSQLREQYALVIWDFPEAQYVASAQWLAGALDAGLLVVRSGRVRRVAARQALRRLTAEGMSVVGAVLTDWRRDLPNWVERLI